MSCPNLHSKAAERRGEGGRSRLSPRRSHMTAGGRGSRGALHVTQRPPWSPRRGDPARSGGTRPNLVDPPQPRPHQAPPERLTTAAAATRSARTPPAHQNHGAHDVVV